MTKALIPIAFAAIILGPWADAQAQDEEEGPIKIEKCQTISQPGSYKLVDNLTFNGPTNSICLPITANFVTINLAGFTIAGTSSFPNIMQTAIAAGDNTKGIAVRNGSISGFNTGVDLGGDGSVVEGLRLFGSHAATGVGIFANGIVKGNIVVEFAGELEFGVGIDATGIVTGNNVMGSNHGDDYRPG
jgi:hypothetical protein